MVEMKAMRLPNPCPLPTAFSPAVHLSILQNDISGTCKLKMLRESASFFYGICPFPNPSEYLEMAKTLCNRYPLLQDTHCSNAAYWSTVREYLSQRFRNLRRTSTPSDKCDHKKAVATILPSEQSHSMTKPSCHR
uniref:Uncharacterized protein n=1 Tax=Amphimedon queenslandica TaxID=400682 RepID=A0A1X7T0V6_AMPQE